MIAYEKLSKSIDAKGRPLKIHKIHQPDPIYITEEESNGVDTVDGTISRNTDSRLAGSYINHYIANNIDTHDIFLTLFIIVYYLANIVLWLCYFLLPYTIGIPY